MSKSILVAIYGTGRTALMYCDARQLVAAGYSAEARVERLMAKSRVDREVATFVFQTL